MLSKGLPGPGAFYVRKDGTAGPVCFPDPSFSSTLGHRPREASSLLALFCNYPVIYNPKNLRQRSIKAYTQHITTYYLGAKWAANLLGGGAGPASPRAVGAAGICCGPPLAPSGSRGRLEPGPGAQKEGPSSRPCPPHPRPRLQPGRRAGQSVRCPPDPGASFHRRGRSQTDEERPRSPLCLPPFPGESGRKRL